MDNNVLILGAGPAGMSAALRLLNNNVNFSVVEKKENIVGGLAKTIDFGPFSLDIGPHILCTKPYVYDYNEKIYHFIRELLGKQLIFYETSNRKYLETVRVGGDEFDYPIQIKNALQNVGFIHALHMVYDYMEAKSARNLKEDTSFEQIITTQLGQSLADLFILKYSEKNLGTQMLSPLF
ncbi:NAD(P)-binding protein [Methanosarcina horonobensis]|uniref:NAD(P)-binding protein n=1 Tax=Methanosarcina horonobensis TaxID=418008 RepID=UPI000A7E56E3|nr:NAD(P)-binding protein [Methanosarcina horonobensis]